MKVEFSIEVQVSVKVEFSMEMEFCMQVRFCVEVKFCVKVELCEIRECSSKTCKALVRKEKNIEKNANLSLLGQ